jgi:hypothetical protein
MELSRVTSDETALLPLPPAYISRLSHLVVKNRVAVDWVTKHAS